MNEPNKSLLRAQSALIQADYTGYQAAVASLPNAYRDYPRVVSIETQVKCNAKCVFCPYPVSPRQGEEMPDRVFHKIIDDLSEIPSSHAFTITLHRINEPLLDRRMREFSTTVAQRLPSASQQFWTNGTMLKEGGFEWMTDFAKANLSVSLNSIDEAEHQKMMGLGLDGVFKGLDYLHKLVAAKQFTLPVVLCAPYQSLSMAAQYEAFCRQRWPLFRPAIRPFFQWMGHLPAGAEQRGAADPIDPLAAAAESYACGQWFDLHILANGYSTKCCIDETGYVGNPTCDVRRNHVLDIYRARLDMRLNLPARKDVAGCEGCLHLG